MSMRCYLANEGDSVGQGYILYTRSVSMNAVVDNVSVMLCMSMTLLIVNDVVELRCYRIVNDVVELRCYRIVNDVVELRC